MPAWKAHLRGDPTPWLLEEDADQPGVRYFALQDLLGMSEEDAQVRAARADIMRSGPVPAILSAQSPEGWWVKPGRGYAPKFRGTVWSLIFLAQFGADPTDSRVQRACEYVLTHSIAEHRGFCCTIESAGYIHCLSGNLGAALTSLGPAGDERLYQAMQWHARVATGQPPAGIEPPKGWKRPYATPYASGPGYICVGNGYRPCAWGAVKSLLAFGATPSAHRTPEMQAAIDAGVELLLSRDPAIADYPRRPRAPVSPLWRRFHYPVAYDCDLLQLLGALAAVGRLDDPRLANALALVESKQDADGRWPMEHAYTGRTWADAERNGAPSKWVTLRALRVLRAAYGE